MSAYPPPNGAPLRPTEVLRPSQMSLRRRLGETVFSNRNLDHLSHLLDDCFVVPGTSIRFGIDGIIGLVPFAGDALAGILSSLIVIAAWFRGAPPVLIARMLVNLALDVVIGAIPLFGDAFDIAWKANRRNYALLSRHLVEPGQHRLRDWAFLLALACALVAIFAVPLIVLGYLLALAVHHV